VTGTVAGPVGSPPSDLLADPGTRLHEFPTTSGMSVSLHRTAEGDLVVVKTPVTGAPRFVRAALAAQARQLAVLARTHPDAPYPAVLEGGRDRLVLSYAPGTTLRDGRADVGEARSLSLLAEAVTIVFGLAARWPEHACPPPGHGFLVAEMTRRMSRLDVMLSGGWPGGELARAIRPGRRGGVLARLHAAHEQGTLARADAALCPPLLGFGAHGDLTPQNVVRAAAGDELTLIDPRGLVCWRRGLPWWDPVLDLAAAITFHGAIDRLSGEPDPLVLASGLAATRTALAERVAATAAGAGWTATDTFWDARLDLWIGARLLGNVAVQLTYGRDEAVDRARTVYLTCEAWFGRCWKLLDGAGRPAS
jgi:hypothetical protein